jgi:single-strand DNA-binding protein
MYESLTIIGRLGGDPELRYTPAGQAVANFSVAVNARWTDKDGESQEKVTWYRIACWGRLGEVCNQYLAKGRMVMVTARRIAAEAYVDKDGKPRAALKVTADAVKFLDNAGTDPGARVDSDEEPSEMPF